MSLADRNRAKLRCFRHLLDNGVTALHLDARAPGVQVPARFADNPWLVLNYSHRYHVADFAFDDDGVRASLTFGGVPFLCVVPWTAVFAITDDARTEGQHWPEDLPADAHRQKPQAQSARAKAQPVDADALPDQSNEAPVRRGLRAIEGGRTDDEAPADAAPETPAAPRPAGHLRRVK